jgi:hypothetical protein
MSKEKVLLKQLVNRRLELGRTIDELRTKLQQSSELLLRVEGAIEAFGLVDIKLDEEAASVEPEPEVESPE